MQHRLKCAARCLSQSVATSGRRTLDRITEGFSKESYSTFNALKKLKSPTAKLLVQKIANRNPYVKTVTRSPLSNAIERAKTQHPHHVILIWNGDCYEAHGVDAAICVEHCGIEPTAMTPHVDIPLQRLQAVVNDLNRHGVKVAIYKYVVGLETDNDEEYMVRKRALVFSHEATEHDEFLTNMERTSAGHDHRVAIGVTHNRSGYSISTIIPATCVMEIRQRLTLPAAVDLLQSVDSRVIIFQNRNLHVKKLLSHLPTVMHYEPIQGRIDTDAFHKAVCDNIKIRLNIKNKFKITTLYSNAINVQTLDPETAAGLGINTGCTDASIKHKPLHLQMLPVEAPAYMKRYMRYLITHVIPEENVANIRYLASKLAQVQLALLDIKPIGPAKVDALMSQYKIEFTHLLDVYNTIKAFKYYTEAMAPAITRRVHALTLADLQVHFTMERSKQDARKCRSIIESTIICETDETDTPMTGIACIDHLFKTSESNVARINKRLMVRERYQLDEAAYELLRTIASDYMGIPEANIDHQNHKRTRQDISSMIQQKVEINADINKSITMNDNIIVLQQFNNEADHTKLQTIEYTQTVIGNCKVVCYYSQNVTEALIKYRNKCLLEEAKANRILIQVRKSLAPYSQSIVIMSHFVMIVQTLAAHVGMAVAKGWNIPLVANNNEIILKHLVPQRSEPDDVVPFYIHLKGVHMLSSQNNSARTTCINTVLAACVAANLGLYVPCGSASRVPKLKKISYHSPADRTYTEAMCPSEYTMSTIEHIIETANEDTLVMIDNLGSNLETAKVTAFVAYVLKQLVDRQTIALIATNASNISGKCLQGVHCNTIEKKNGCMIMVETVPKVTLLTDIFPNNLFIQRAQEYINTYSKDDKVNMDMKNVDTGVALAGPPDQDGGTKELNAKDTSDYRLINNIPINLRDAATVVIKVIEEVSLYTANIDLVHIFENAMPPPMLINTPATYILLIPITTKQTNACQAKGGVSLKNNTVAVYVGETGNLAGRLKAHRAKAQYTVDEYLGKTYMCHEEEMTQYLREKNKIENTEDAGFLEWNGAHALAIKMDSRMQAKLYERKIINRLYNSQNAITLLSHRDGVYREIAPID